MTEWENCNDVELVLNKIRINCSILAEYHRERYISLKSRIKFFRIPVLILSAINSVISVGLNLFIKQQIVSVINCLVSLVCGIIVSVELFLQIQTQMDIDNSNGKDYYILSIDIFKVLSLDRENRQSAPIIYLENIYAEYCKIKSASTTLNSKIKDLLEEVPISSIRDIYTHSIN